MRYDWRRASKYVEYKELWISGVGYTISIKPWSIYQHTMYTLWKKVNNVSARRMFKYSPQLKTITWDRKHL